MNIFSTNHLQQIYRNLWARPERTCLNSENLQKKVFTYKLVTEKIYLFNGKQTKNTLTKALSFFHQVRVVGERPKSCSTMLQCGNEDNINVKIKVICFRKEVVTCASCCSKSTTSCINSSTTVRFVCPPSRKPKSVMNFKYAPNT